MVEVPKKASYNRSITALDPGNRASAQQLSPGLSEQRPRQSTVKVQRKGDLNARP